MVPFRYSVPGPGSEGVKSAVFEVGTTPSPSPVLLAVNSPASAAENRLYAPAWTRCARGGGRGGDVRLNFGAMPEDSSRNVQTIVGKPPRAKSAGAKFRCPNLGASVEGGCFGPPTLVFRGRIGGPSWRPDGEDAVAAVSSLGPKRGARTAQARFVPRNSPVVMRGNLIPYQ
jgi:hypothetical protein